MASHVQLPVAQLGELWVSDYSKFCHGLKQRPHQKGDDCEFTTEDVGNSAIDQAADLESTWEAQANLATCEVLPELQMAGSILFAGTTKMMDLLDF